MRRCDRGMLVLLTSQIRKTGPCSGRGEGGGTLLDAECGRRAEHGIRLQERGGRVSAPIHPTLVTLNALGKQTTENHGHILHGFHIRSVRQHQHQHQLDVRKRAEQSAPLPHPESGSGEVSHASSTPKRYAIDVRFPRALSQWFAKGWVPSWVWCAAPFRPRVSGERTTCLWAE